jgi:prevent-host-death family protein
MEKGISIGDARQQLESIVQEVQVRGDRYVVSQDGEPVAVVIPVELYEQWKRDREVFFQRWDAIAVRADVPPDEAEDLAQEAVRAVRQARG